MEEKKINNISSVCVYCASSTKIPSVYFDAAKELVEEPDFLESYTK